MRHWFFSLILAILVVTAGNTQEPKKKGKDGEKDSKTAPEITEIAGKTFEQWTKEIHAQDPSQREIAIKTILNFGPDKAAKALPDILAELKKHSFNSPVDLSVRVNGTLAISTIFKYMHLNKKEPDPKHVKEAVDIFKKSLNDNQVVLRIRTVQALPYLGAEARDAVKDVVTMVRDKTTWEARQAAIQTLAIVAFDPKGPPASSVLVALFSALEVKTESSAHVRHAAALAFGPLAVNLTPTDKNTALLRLNKAMLDDPSPQVRHGLVQTLSFLGASGNNNDKVLVITKLYKALDDNSPLVRIAAIQGIAQVAHGLATAMEKNTVCLRLNTSATKDSETAVQMWAHLAIMNIKDSFTKDHLDPMTKFLQHKDPAVRLQSLQLIGMAGPKARLAVPAVTGSITDTDANVALAAMVALVHLDAYDAMPALEKLKNDKKASEYLREGAEEAWDQLDYKLKAAKSSKDKKTDKK